MKIYYISFVLIFLTNLSFSQIAYPVPDYSVCDDFSNDGVETFDLSIFNSTVLGSQNPNDFILTYHMSQTDAINNTGIITNTNSFTNITNPQRIFTRVTDANSTANWDQSSFDLIISYAPIAVTLTPLEVCDANIDGFEVFDLATKDAEIINGQTTIGAINTIISYHENQTDAWNNTNPLMQLYSNIIPFNQTIYARVGNSSNLACADVSSLELVALDCTDSDNDGVIDIHEDINSNGNLDDDDTDMDQIPNYLDDDDDGDGVLTINEDYNNNGDPTDDDTDNSGVPDYLERNVFLSISSLKNVSYNMFPNPSKGLVIINGFYPILNTSVFSLQGKAVNPTMVTISSTELQFDTSNLESGVYFVKIKSEIGLSVMKLIVN